MSRDTSFLVGLDLPCSFDRINACSEDVVDFFQSQICQLGEKEVKDRNESKIQDGENKVSLPLETIDDSGRDHDDEEIPQPYG